jgi:hypothetical protein
LAQRGRKNNRECIASGLPACRVVYPHNDCLLFSFVYKPMALGGREKKAVLLVQTIGNTVDRQIQASLENQAEFLTRMLVIASELPPGDMMASRASIISMVCEIAHRMRYPVRH